MNDPMDRQEIESLNTDESSREYTAEEREQLDNDWEREIYEREGENIPPDEQIPANPNLHPLFDELLRDFQRNLLRTAELMRKVGQR